MGHGQVGHSVAYVVDVSTVLVCYWVMYCSDITFNYFISTMGHSRPLFSLFSIHLVVHINFADDWIRTADLWYRKGPTFNYFVSDYKMQINDSQILT